MFAVLVSGLRSQGLLEVLTWKNEVTRPSSTGDSIWRQTWSRVHSGVFMSAFDGRLGRFDRVWAGGGANRVSSNELARTRLVGG